MFKKLHLWIVKGININIQQDKVKVGVEKNLKLKIWWEVLNLQLMQVEVMSIMRIIILTTIIKD